MCKILAEISLNSEDYTTNILLLDIHVWSSALESCGESRVISLDISKAFDRVWHKGLLAKLPMFGLNQTLIIWIGSFLSDRSIAVRVDGFFSNLHSIDAGVPQGSVISFVLFILFINDLLTSTSSSIYSFADDTFLHFHSIQMTMLPPISNSTETFQPRFCPMIWQLLRTTYFRSTKARRHRLSFHANVIKTFHLSS